MVRDKIPEIIRQHGKTPVVRRIADQDEFAQMVRKWLSTASPVARGSWPAFSR